MGFLLVFSTCTCNCIIESAYLNFLQGVPEQKLRAHLGSFGVTGNLALQPMYTLSGIVFIGLCCHHKFTL